MERYTERVRFSMPAAEKERLRTKAASLHVSMSELIRRASHDLMVRNELEVLCAESELHQPEATIQ